MPRSRIFNKQITPGSAYSQLSALLLANGYDGTLSLSQLKIIDLAGDSVIIFTDDATSPSPSTTGEIIGASGVAKQQIYDGTASFIDATCVWIYQASNHAITVSIISY